jgi:signal transduction histidine kinase
MQLKPLAGTVEIALRMLRPRAADKGVSLSVVEAGGAALVARHDPSRFAHAIINIVANAIDSAADGGRHVWLSVTVDTNAICIRVDDDGPGISETIQDRLFELFATTKAPGHGTGIGLALTREIVTEHAGSVSLVNREPNGARAVILLPLPKTQPEPEAESPGA